MCEKEEEVAALGSALLGWQIMGCLQSCPRRTCVHVPDQHKASDHDDISSPGWQNSTAFVQWLMYLLISMDYPVELAKVLRLILLISH